MRCLKPTELQSYRFTIGLRHTRGAQGRSERSEGRVMVIGLLKQTSSAVTTVYVVRRHHCTDCRVLAIKASPGGQDEVLHPRCRVKHPRFLFG